MCKSWIQYIFLITFLFLLAVLYDSYITLLVLLVFIILPLLLLVIGLVSRSKVLAGMKLDVKTVQKGQVFPINIYIENHSFIPIAHCNVSFEYGNQYIKSKKKEKLTISISGYQQHVATCKVSSEYCGILEFSVTDIRIMDFFGLFSLRLPCPFQFRITVLPDTDTMESPLVRHNPWVSSEPEEYALNKSGDDCSELFGVREYLQGDRFNRIHWRLSDRLDKLIVKEFGLPIDSSVAILADFFIQNNEKKQLAQFDAVVEILCFISGSLLEQGQAHYVFWFNSSLKECCKMKISKAEDFYELIGNLLECNAYSSNSSVLKYYRTANFQELFTNMYHITSSITEEDVLAWDELDSMAWRHVVLINGQEAMRSESLLKHHKISNQILDIPYTRSDIEKAVYMQVC